MAEIQNTVRRLLLQPLLWALIYGALIAYGAYALWKIPVEVLPRFNFPQISVITHQAGATTSELETQITWPLEGEILALPNLVGVRSTMGNGTVETDVRFEEGTGAQSDLQAVNGAIDRARGGIPASAHPYAEIMGNAINEVADYSARIPVDVPSAQVERAVLANVVPALRALSGVQRVEVYGAGEEALWVQPNLTAMVRFQVSITAITQALQQEVLLKPDGYLTQGHQDVFIEMRNLPVSIAELEQIPVTSANGPIPLGDLARIVRAPVPTLNAVLLDGHPSIALIVFKQPSSSTVPVTRAVQTTLTQTSNQLPGGVHWVSIYDQGHLVHVVGADLARNLLIGGLLAIAVMLWVLGAGRGIWVLALSIPLSLLLGVAGLYATGQSLNLMTLGALHHSGRAARRRRHHRARKYLPSLGTRRRSLGWNCPRAERHSQPRRFRNADDRLGLRSLTIRRWARGTLLYPLCASDGAGAPRVALDLANSGPVESGFPSCAAPLEAYCRRKHLRPIAQAE